LTTGDGGWYWSISLSCIGLALAFALAGFVLVARRYLVLKARIDAYGQLPVVVLASFTGDTIARLGQASRDGTQLLPRAQRALIDLQEARESLARSTTTISDGARAVGRFFSSRR
jgi:hypothetical protein